MPANYGEKFVIKSGNPIPCHGDMGFYLPSRIISLPHWAMDDKWPLGNMPKIKIIKPKLCPEYLYESRAGIDLPFCTMPGIKTLEGAVRSR